MARTLYLKARHELRAIWGETMKISVWLFTRERAVWVVAAESLALAYVLVTGPGPVLRLLVGLPLLVHLGYTAMTAVPIGMIPGRPEDAQERRNQDLRSWVVRFLNEVKELEDYMWRARTAEWTAEEVDRKLSAGRKRVMAAATEVSRAVGQSSDDMTERDEIAATG